MSEMQRDVAHVALAAGLEANMEAFALYCRRVPSLDVQRDAGLT